jgi:hypothetical protein
VTGRRRPDGRDRGSISIELVGVLPILVVAVVVLIEGLLLASAVEDTSRAARDAAREASRGGDGVAAAQALLPNWIRVERVDVGAAPGCEGVCGTVEVSVPLGFPGAVELSRVHITRTADFPATSVPAAG